MGHKPKRNKSKPRPQPIERLSRAQTTANRLALAEIHDRHTQLLTSYHGDPPIQELWNLRAARLKLNLGVGA